MFIAERHVIFKNISHTVTLLADPGIFTIAVDDKVDVIAGGVALPLWLSGGGL